MSAIYFIIFILFISYLVWTWKSTKEYESIISRASYILVGSIFITVVTLVIFEISKMGVIYPKDEMIGEVRKIILLIFVPVNGLIVLTQSASVFSQVKSGMVSKEDMSKRIRILAVVFIIMIIIECIYFKSIQNGMIKIINAI